LQIGGYKFNFNGIDSDTYKASIVFIEGTPTKRTSGGNKTVTSYHPQRSARQRLLNVTYEEVLSFMIEIVFDDPVGIDELLKIKTWLSAPMGYKKLYIYTPDSASSKYYWNGYFTLTNDLVYNGGFRGLSCTFTCDAPWGWGDSITTSISTGTHEFNNVSDDAEPVKPILSFKQTSDIAYLTLEDTTSSRVFIYSNVKSTMSYTCSNGTVVAFPTYYSYNSGTTNISINCENAVITSNKGISIAHFVNPIFKITQGVTNIKVTAQNVSNITLTYMPAKRIGGDYY